MKSPRILLIGIGGVYNYGCEAIVRGTEAILRSAWPDIRVVYASCRPEDDRARLAGCDVEVVHRQLLGRYSMKRVAAKLVSLTGIRWHPMADSRALLDGHAAVLSIGGDIYTLDPRGRFGTSLAKFGDYAERHRTPYVLWGASVGPFSGNPKAERFFKRHLSKISLITARESYTVNYLAGISISANVVACADPAFAVAPEVKKNTGRIGAETTIAINLSPLSAKYAGLTTDHAIVAQSRAIERIIEAYRAKIILVPHVVCEFYEGDDDYRYLRHILETMSRRCRERIDLLSPDLGFIGTKRVLSQCDLVIATRMHCAISALTARVPTLLLAYSQKAVGMCEYIYGRNDWTLPVDELCSDRCLASVGKMLDSSGSIQVHLSRRIPEVQSDTRSPIKALAQII